MSSAAFGGFGITMDHPRQTYMIMPLEKKVDTLFSFLRAQAAKVKIRASWVDRIGPLVDVEMPRFSLAEEGHCLRVYLQTSAVRLSRMTAS